jgi:hypothetical protein
MLARCCDCAWVEKHAIAERETVACANGTAQARCLSLYELLLHSAAFALRHVHKEEPLTHAQEMKLQCGGLRGLQRAADGTSEVCDVSALVGAARRQFGSLEALPYAQIMQSVASTALRKRREPE